jgi:hypothetical protein
MPYSTFISLSITLHQVCSSDFVTEPWIAMMRLIPRVDWYGLDARHFRLLSSLCQLIRETIDDAIHRFLTRSFVTLNVLTEPNFNAELNTTLNQFNQTLVTNFDLLVNTVHLFTQVDQPFTLPNDQNSPVFSVTPSQNSNQHPPQV